MTDHGEPLPLQDWIHQLTLHAYSEGEESENTLSRLTQFVAAAAEASDEGTSEPSSRSRMLASAVNARLLEALQSQRRLQDSLAEYRNEAQHGACALRRCAAQIAISPIISLLDGLISFFKSTCFSSDLRCPTRWLCCFREPCAVPVAATRC